MERCEAQGCEKPQGHIGNHEGWLAATSWVADTMPNCDDGLLEFLETHAFPGKVIFAKLWGSHSHNTNVPGSDTDYLVVYACAPRDMLGLNPAPDTVDGKGPDFEAHEIGKFARLLLKGNPGMIECLFTEKNFYESEEWASLVVHRRLFLSRRVVDQYLGYATGQLKRLQNATRLHTKGGEYNTKWAYHLMRVLEDGFRIAKGQEPLVWKIGKPRDLLMDIRKGVFEPEHITAMAEEAIGYINGCEPWPLQDIGDEAFLNEWLLKTRGL